MLVCSGLVAQARSRLDSFRKITPPSLAKVHSGPTRTCFAEPFTEVNRVVQAIQFDIESQITGTTCRSGISSELGQGTKSLTR
jgi:nucleotidyltransferase/DNA polymerase involved in DNA repair